MATGNPRNKVALAPGRSLMDWIRLTNSGVDLTGVGGRRREVTKDELARHSRPGDLWMALRGQVYNVTRYVEYHPGGADELMRAAGADGTELFDSVHRWVNYEGMLSKCLVGKYVGEQSLAKSLIRKALGVGGGGGGSSGNSLAPPPGPASLRPPAPAPARPPPRPAAGPDFDWFQSPQQLHLITYCRQPGLTADDVSVRLTGRRLLCRVYLRDSVFTLHWELPEDVSPDAHTSVSSAGKVEIVLEKRRAAQWASTGRVLAGHRTSTPLAQFCPEFVSFVLVERRPVSHDTRLLLLQPPAGCSLRVPLGFHVFVRRTVCGAQLERPYTPVPESVGEAAAAAAAAERQLCLMVKVYPDGVLTPQLDALRLGQTLEVSEPVGTFRRRPQDVAELVALAAGTGLTPMVGLVRAVLDQSAEAPVRLVTFVRRQRDLLWPDQWAALAERQARFSVLHVLSEEEAESAWSGRRGRVSAPLLEELIPEPARPGLLVAVCGPTAFSAACSRLLAELGVPGQQVHVFDG
ncbi:Cytochrome b5 reductase 4 [Amphibalanus amphitrite]|uniref:Cytochrome b5 reductase 4 n=1 Tax=Amphibalanus amphitrite TaxID=1232801 RepID=A0A6A4WTA3_AMPAM|nr:Cytochrome b5 reductase 4 [Amphibalanus amphitrite]